MLGSDMACDDNADEPIDGADSSIFEITTNPDGTINVADRLTGATVSSYTYLLDVVPNPDGTTRRIDRITGRTVIACDGFIVEYLDCGGSVQIIDRLHNKQVMDYNKRFVEYDFGNGKARLVDRKTGEEAIDDDIGYDYIVHFFNQFEGHRYFDRNTCEEIDPEEIDWETTNHTNNVTLRRPPCDWQPTADPVTSKACFEGWEPMNKMPIENEVTKINDDYLKQDKWLKLETDGLPVPPEAKNARWWSAHKNRRVGGYVFKPKRGPSTFIWLKQDYESCPTLEVVRKSLDAFMKRVADNDYFEPLTFGEKDWQYLCSRARRQLSWLKLMPNDPHSQRIIELLKWWECDDVLGIYKFESLR